MLCILNYIKEWSKLIQKYFDNSDLDKWTYLIAFETYLFSLISEFFASYCLNQIQILRFHLWICTLFPLLFLNRCWPGWWLFKLPIYNLIIVLIFLVIITEILLCFVRILAIDFIFDFFFLLLIILEFLFIIFFLLVRDISYISQSGDFIEFKATWA